MLSFKELKNEAMKQLEKSWWELEDMFWEEPENEKLAEAMLKLRSLSEDSRFSLNKMLCEDEKSFLSYFQDIINPKEFLRLPDSISQLISGFRYNILDDGFLRLMRIEIVDEIEDRFSKMPSELKNRKKVNYFLYSNENINIAQLAKDKLMSDINGFINPVLVSAKINYFASIQELIIFIEIISRPNNWDSFDFLGNDELEALMCFYEIENQLTEKISRKVEFFSR